MTSWQRDTAKNFNPHLRSQQVTVKSTKNNIPTHIYLFIFIYCHIFLRKNQVNRMPISPIAMIYGANLSYFFVSYNFAPFSAPFSYNITCFFLR